MKHAGFSLIELLITMAITATLSAIAYPSYRHHIQTSYRQQAQISLHAAAQQLEQYYHQHHNYKDARLNEHNEHYQLKLHTPRNHHYTIIATPTGAQSDDRCGQLRLSDNGKHTAQDTKCW